MPQKQHVMHGRDHEHGAADPIHIAWEDVGGGGSGGGGGGITIQDEGTPLALRSVLNFIGSDVTAEDDAANARTNVSIASSSLPVAGGGITTPAGTPVPLTLNDNDPIPINTSAFWLHNITVSTSPAGFSIPGTMTGIYLLTVNVLIEMGAVAAGAAKGIYVKWQDTPMLTNWFDIQNMPATPATIWSSSHNFSIIWKVNGPTVISFYAYAKTSYPASPAASSLKIYQPFFELQRIAPY